MKHLIINGKEVEPKVGLHFGSYLDKYHDKADGSPVTRIYYKLLEWKQEELTLFWMAATAHLSEKERPSRHDIENSIQDALQSGVKLKTLCREAAYTIETSTTYKASIRRLFADLELIRSMGTTWNEKLENKRAYWEMRNVLARRKRVYFQKA